MFCSSAFSGILFFLLIIIELHSILCLKQLPCVPCGDVQCGATPKNCELDKIPCGCCYTCVRLLGEVCESFSPRCGTGLKCLTPGGLYDGRPPWYKPYFRGVCITDPTLAGLVPTRGTHNGPIPTTG